MNIMTRKEGILKIQDFFGVGSIYAKNVFALADKSNLLKDVDRIIKERPKPFVKWVGGKRQLLKQFKELGLYPPEDFNPNTATYFEPFVGGGAVFFDLFPQKAILLDLNFELITTYNVIKNDVGDLIKSLKKHKHNKEYFLKMRVKNPKRLSKLNIASRFIYLNRTGFNGLYRVNKNDEFNVPFGRYNNPLICDEENLRKIHNVLQKVDILHKDYKEVLNIARKGDFVYLDPPYYPVNRTSNFTSYTSKDFLEKEQEELRDAFVELHKKRCFVMLSNSDTPFINKLYSGLNKRIKIHKIRAGRMINSNAKKRGKINEVLVINY